MNAEVKQTKEKTAISHSEGNAHSATDDDGDLYSVTLAFRQTTDNQADGGQ
jgi:hypothetical protein